MSTPTYTREEFLNTYITATTIPTDDPDCPICKDAYDTSSHQAVTFSDEGCCNHVYGKSCLIQWLETENINTCAMCRRELFCLSDGDSDSEVEDWEIDADDDDLSYYSEEEEGEEEDGIFMELTLEDYSAILEATWYKIWWLRTTSGPSPCRNYLTHVFLTTMARYMGGCVYLEGSFGDYRVVGLGALLLEMMDVQRLHSEEEPKDEKKKKGERDQEMVPEFSGAEEWVKKLVGILRFNVMVEQSQEGESNQDTAE
jgi:hypothetical protein